MIDRDVFAWLSVDDCRRALKKLDQDQELPEFLRPPDVLKLLNAVAKHDAKCFALTRDEHAGKREPGTTPRYDALDLLTRTLLLTGMRRGEALRLTWSQIDLDAAEIHVRAAGNKTKRARTIDLSVCPSLVPLLKAAKENSIGDHVFDMTDNELKMAVKRLRKFGAPAGFTWAVCASRSRVALLESAAQAEVHDESIGIGVVASSCGVAVERQERGGVRGYTRVLGQEPAVVVERAAASRPGGGFE